jgi:hypothetical protein
MYNALKASSKNPDSSVLLYSNYLSLPAKLDLKIVPAEITQLAFKFMYVGRITVKEDQFKDLIKVADYIQLDGLKNQCAIHLAEVSLTVDNCVTMCILGDMYNIDSLYERSNDMLRLNFQKVMKGDDILQITADSLISLMSDEHLRYIKAMEFFSLAMRWVESDPNRIDEFPKLFACLDLKDISEAGILAIQRCCYVNQYESCQKLFKDHKKLIRTGEFDPSVTEKDVIVVPGGQTSAYLGSRISNCYAYVIEDDKWCQFISMPRNLVGGVAILNGEAFMCGKDGGSLYASMYKLTPLDVKNRWSQVLNEQPRRATDEVYSCAFSKDKKLVSVRRLHAQIFLMSYDLNAPLHIPLQDSCHLQRLLDLPNLKVTVSAKAVAYNEKVFIQVIIERTGGKKNHFFMYNTDTKVLQDYSKGSRLGDVLYLDGDRIYLETPGKRHSHWFDMKKLAWGTCRRGLPPFPNKQNLQNYSVVTQNGNLYVLGGLVSKSNWPSCTLFKFNRKENSWSEMAAPPGGVGLVKAACGVMSVPKDEVRCPLHCPHCKSKLKVPNYLDEDDDDSDSFYAESDSWDGSIYESDIEMPFLLWQ